MPSIGSFSTSAWSTAAADFKDFANDIDQAQADKLEHICRKLRLKPGDRLLDIGCGWGGMLIHAAKNHGVIGHGVSLSEEQTALARERIRAEGLQDRITIDIKSYTDLDGSYDKISSIGMFEHLGLANHDTYFSTLHRLLKPGGIYLHHAITKRDKGSLKKTLRKDPGYKALIKYIFPGGELDTIGMTVGNLEAHGFLVYDVENLREHYAQTCRLWAQRLQRAVRRGCRRGGRAKGEAVAALSRGMFADVQERFDTAFSNGGDTKNARSERPAADAGGFVSVAEDRGLDEPHRRADLDAGRLVDRAVDAEIVRVVTNQIAQDGRVVVETILGDDGEAAAAARLGDGQVEVADRQLSSDPFRFGERPFDCRHVDDDVGAEAARVGSTLGMKRLQARQRRRGQEMDGGLAVTLGSQWTGIAGCCVLLPERPDRRFKAEIGGNGAIAFGARCGQPVAVGNGDLKFVGSRQPGADARHLVPFRVAIGSGDFIVGDIHEAEHAVAVDAFPIHRDRIHALAGERTRRIAPKFGDGADC